MKKIVLLFLICLNANAQTDSTSYFRKDAKFFYLKPIQKNVGRYYYGEQRLRNNFSLEVPFFELNDREVNRYYQKYKVTVSIGSIISLVPSIYVLGRLANPNNPNYNQKTYLAMIITTVGASLTTKLIGNSQVRKAVEKYNEVLGKPYHKTVSNFSLEPSVDNYGLALKVGF